MSARNTQLSSDPLSSDPDPKGGAEHHEADVESLLFDADEMRNGLRGAMLIAAIAVGMLFAGWLAFYFLLFMRRGSVG
jgi:hypothetical protein